MARTANKKKPEKLRKKKSLAAHPKGGNGDKVLLVKDLLAANYSYRIVIAVLLVLLAVVYLNSSVDITVMQENAFEIQQLVIENWEKANISLPHVCTISFIFLTCPSGTILM